MIIGVYMPKLSRQSAHVGPWHYTVLRTTNEAETTYMLTTAATRQQHANPRTQASVSGGLSLSAGSAALTRAATWRFHDHHCARPTLFYQAFPDPESAILWSPLRHTSAQQSAIISPSLIQAVSWLLHGPIMGRYKANKEPDNDHGVPLVIVRPSKRLYLAIIGPDKDLLLSLVLIWLQTGHH